MPDPAGLTALHDAIRHLHGVESRHTERVRDEHGGELVFDREVELFDLIGHPAATRAYAWSEATTGNKRRFFAVLHAGPIDSALAAVRGSIVADARRI